MVLTAGVTIDTVVSADRDADPEYEVLPVDMIK
jgi:hypothetical protein